MALYYDAASILSSTEVSGSLKSRIYNTNNVNLKSKPAQIYALISETAKRDVFLKEVIDNTDLLKDEPKLTPLLSLLLCHDHFFAKSGIAAAVKHPLRQAVERHKARLQAEFTRARLRRKCGSIAQLKDVLEVEKGERGETHPRWVRVNKIKARESEDVIEKLPGATKRDSLSEVLGDSGRDTLSYHVDENIPNLFALSPNTDLTATEAYKSGSLILQDKASCFPAHLLLSGDQSPSTIGDIIDGCAAPGNKTTHLAAITHSLDLPASQTKIFACERDPYRSKTLKTMVDKASASSVEVLARQDFLALDPMETRFERVTHLLLDPSCSGSGILGREDIPILVLPKGKEVPAGVGKSSKEPGQTGASSSMSSKKRKRNPKEEESSTTEPKELPLATSTDATDLEEQPTNASANLSHDRLQKLSNLQSLIVEHAMRFPAATRITYSTCSIHEIENEGVVRRVLKSEVAKSRGWRVLRRGEHVDGMRRWKSRGVRNEEKDGDGDGEGEVLDQEQLDACIRCNPDDEEGTMGFFVCGFVRDGEAEGKLQARNGENVSRAGVVRKVDKKSRQEGAEEAEDDWEGFD